MRARAMTMRGGPAHRGLVFAAGAALLAAAAGCVPPPRGYSAAPRRAESRIAVFPLANYSPARDASSRVAPMLESQIGKLPGVLVIDPGAVEEALAKEPWLLMDRVPPDLVDKLGSALGADAILVGSVLGYGYRDDGGDRIPQISLSLRLVESPGARVLWSAVHSRDGSDSEWLFGFGRVTSLEQLASKTVEEMFETFPERVPGPERRHDQPAKGSGT